MRWHFCLTDDCEWVHWVSNRKYFGGKTLTNNIATCINHFFADRKVQRFIDLARKTRPLQICFPSEVPISRFLAWIFDPSEGHGLHDGVIRSMLTAAWNAMDDAELDLPTQRLLSPAHLTTRSFSGCMIQREARIVDGAGQLDVLILHPQSKLLIAVENKFGAGQGDEQLRKYRNALAKRFPDWERVHIFLDLYGQAPNDSSWIGLDFDWLVDELRAAEQSPWLGAEPRRVIGEFRSSIELEGDSYDHLPLNDSELLEIVQEHEEVLRVMQGWQLRGRRLPELVDEIHAKGATMAERALHRLLPAYWTRADLWRICISMLSYAKFLAAARAKFPGVQADPRRKSFYFTMPSWEAMAKDGNERWPLQVMLRVRPPTDKFKAENYVIVASLLIEEVHLDWEEKIRDLAAIMRARHLKRNAKVKDDQGSITLCVAAVGTEAEARKALVTQIGYLNKEVELLMATT